MDYIVISTAVTDDMTLADGQHMGKMLGGAGSYALCGIKLWSDNVTLVTGIGEDFAGFYKKWFANNQISMEGLMIKDPFTAVSNVRYSFDGERIETPQYGLDHYTKLEASPEEIYKFAQKAKGVYIFRDNNPQFWEKVLQIKQDCGFSLMWEINASCCVPAMKDSIRQIASHIDVFSINRREICSLFGAVKWEHAVSQLAEWGIPMLFVRLGAKGAVIVRDGRRYMIPSIPNAIAKDVTGGGNSSSAAVLYGYCEKFEPFACGVMGSISAAYCIKQYGVPPIFSEIDRESAVNLREQMCKK